MNISGLWPGNKSVIDHWPTIIDWLVDISLYFAQSGDHMICQLIERMAIIDHHDNNQSINWLNHNQFTALLAITTYEM